MRLLLDTHIALWAIADDARLSATARQLIASPDNEIWISVASLWEIAIKYSLGRGDMPVSSEQSAAYFLEAGYRMLAVRPEHTHALEKLPPLHADPFDRMLVAQAQTEPLVLLTHDQTIARYDGTVLQV